MKVMLKLIGLVKPLAWAMALAIVCGVVGNFCAILIPVLGIAAIAGISSTTYALTLCAICGVLRGAFRYAEQTCNHFIAFKLLALIRERIFEALRKLCPAKLDGRSRGELISLITADVELLEVFYAHTISPVAIALISSAITAVAIGSFHPALGLIAALGYITVGALLPLLASKTVRTGNAELRDKASKFSGFWLDSLRGLTELLRFGRASERGAAIGAKTDDMDALREKLNVREGIISGVSGMLVTLFALAELAVAIALCRSGAVELGSVIVTFTALFSSFGPVLALANLSGGLPATLAAGERVLSILEETPETPDVAGGETPNFTGAESRKLTFSYGEETVLRDFSLKLEPGKITAIVGKSGSGKSTFLKLLMRFWNAPEDSLLISNTQVGNISTAHLRTMEAFMTQDTNIFHDTIAANIRIARSDASDADVVSAAKKAALHEFVESLPKGYDTQVGELGSTLSGGERQRIGLARAFLHDAPFLLLDEPTSNLDSLNEGVILKALREECTASGRTVALVSHRASTTGVADTIYSVESGKAKGPSSIVSHE